LVDREILITRLGDLFMSLIPTCELNKVNPFDYLTTLLRHPVELSVCPAEWMPGNYRRDAPAYLRLRYERVI
jgi:hypothetical protein